MTKSCYEYSINLLSKYPKTEKEIRIKLYQKGYDSEMVINTIEKLKKDNFINDAMFAESYLNSEVIRKGKPLFLIKQKLLQRGVEEKLINSFIHEHEEEINEGILKGIEKEIKQYKKKDVEGFDIIQKLMRKGYRL